MIKGSKLFGDSDNQGNKLFLRVFFNEQKENQSAIIHLQLISEKKSRLLGKYDFHNKTFYCHRKMDKHYHYAAKGFGFNWRLLSDPYLAISRIHIVVDDDTHYDIPKSLIEQYGKFMNFKQQGFELQKFLSLNLIKLHNRVSEPSKNEPLNDRTEFENHPDNSGQSMV